jgi:hypothetical protein
MTVSDVIPIACEPYKNTELSSAKIKELVQKHLDFNVKKSSILPSDFCYNRYNKGIKFNRQNRYFIFIKPGLYHYVGPNYPFTGEVIHKPTGEKREYIYGYYKNGVFERA